LLKVRICGGVLGLVTIYCCALLAVAEPALAGRDFGSATVYGSLESQNLFRMKDPGDFQPVQQRNTLRAGLDLQLVSSGKLISELSSERREVPWVRNASLHLLYRGVYDSIYDWVPGGNLFDLTGKAVGTMNDLTSSQRKRGRFADNSLREAFIDLELKEVPLSFRFGRQQIVWGETDFFRLMDRVNSLDLTWHLQQEIEVQKGWERIRVPSWMLKWNFQLPEMGPVSDAFLEGYWNPGDWNPAKRGFLTFYPWSIPLADPYSDFLPNGLAEGDLFRQGDYSRNPGENSQVGIRFAGYAGGVNFALAYFWQRWSGDDGSNSAVVEAIRDEERALAAVSEGKLPAEFIAPYTHTIGISGNYYEESFTEAVLKAEMVYIFGVPFQDGDKPSPVLPSFLFGTSKRDMWQGMLGFDRPTSIPWLNPDATWLILGQFFWKHIIENERAVGDQTGFVGNLSPREPLVDRETGLPCANPTLQRCDPVDKVRDWEALITLTGTSFYFNGKVAPQITYILDPVNKFNMEVFWGVDWFVTDYLTANIGQRYFINTTSETVHESWGVGGFNRGRSETQIRFTLQL
jgi:hypothetical protein